MKSILLLVGFLVLSNPVALYAEPSKDGKSAALSNAVILVIRHGEKPASGQDLSAVGEARARAYADYFKNYTMDGQPLKLDCLFAASDTKVSHRARLTLEPTSKMLGLKIDSSFDDSQFKKVADELRSEPRCKNILICWHHGDIPPLIEALGADPSRLFPKSKWPEETYNWVIQLRYDSDGKLVEAKRINEPF